MKGTPGQWKIDEEDVAKAKFDRGIKLCRVCGVDKPLAEFCNNSALKDGKAQGCKPCEKYKRSIESEASKIRAKRYLRAKGFFLPLAKQNEEIKKIVMVLVEEPSISRQ